MSKEFYDILEIPENASSEDIKKAYRKIAMQYHPDKNIGDKQCEDKFKKINEAYETLSDPQKREMYDLGHDPNARQGFGNFDPFANFAGFNPFGGGFNFGQNVNQQERNRNIKIKFDIPLREAFTGIDKNIIYKRECVCQTCSGSGGKSEQNKTACPQCKGAGHTQIRPNAFMSINMPCGHCKGQKFFYKNSCTSCNGNGIVEKEESIIINIPAGADTGYTFKKDGYGHQVLEKHGDSFRGGRFGLFSAFIEVMDDKFYRRNGNRIECIMPVPMHLFFTGGEIDVPTLHGKCKIQLSQKELKNNIIKISGKGFPIQGSKDFGDMFVEVYPEVPQIVSEEVADAMKKIQIDSEVYPTYFANIERF